MAEAHHILFWPSNDDFAIMRASAEKALELAPTSSEAHQAVGLINWEEWNWAAAEEEYRRAIELNPNNANAHELLGDTLDVQGKMDEGWKEEETAQELDPNADHLSWPLFRRGQYDRAIALAGSVVESDPEESSMLWQLSESYARKGLYKQWADEWSKSLAAAGFAETAARVRRAFIVSGYSGALRQTVRDGERAVTDKQGYFPGILAEKYAELGDKDRAFYWLQQGCEHHYQAMSDPLLQWAKVDPGFASLHSDPRFKDVLRCMALPY
jgi:serine/threonine-protein kinase